MHIFGVHFSKALLSAGVWSRPAYWSHSFWVLAFVMPGRASGHSRWILNNGRGGAVTVCATEKGMFSVAIMLEKMARP